MTRATCSEHSRHAAGCHGCRKNGAKRSANRNRAIAYGTYRGFQDPAEARAHVLQLRDRHGMSGTRIATKAGISQAVVHHLIRVGTSPLHARVHDALLAVQPDPPEPADTDLVPSVGAARRLQALTARGHTLDKLAAELGIGAPEVSRWRRGYRPSLTAARDRDIRHLYQRLALIDGGDDKTIAIAHAEGWAPPAAWDSDEDMDDPAARPDMSVVRNPICEVLQGRRTVDSLSPGDRLRAVEYLIALHHSDQEICDRLHWRGDRHTVGVYRRRLNLPPGSYRGEPKRYAIQARERRRDAFLRLTPAEKTAAIDRFDFDSEPVTKVAQAVGCSVSTIESRRSARAAVRDREADPVVVRRAVDGQVRFSALNHAEKLLLFATYGQTMPLSGLLKTLRISAGTHREWMDRAFSAAVAEERAA